VPTKRSITASATSNWEWQLVTATGNVRILEELHNPAEGLIILVLAPKSTLNGKATILLFHCWRLGEKQQARIEHFNSMATF